MLKKPTAKRAGKIKWDNQDHFSWCVFEEVVYQLTVKLPGAKPSVAWDLNKNLLSGLGFGPEKRFAKFCKDCGGRQR